MGLFFLIMSLVSTLFATEIELFIDWRPEAKGQDLFPLDHPGLLGQLRKELLIQGSDISSWDRQRYFPWLLSWSHVHSWNELKNWLGFGLPRKNPIEESDRCWMFWGLGPKLKGYDFRRVDPDRLILFLWEPPVVQPEGYDPKIYKQFGKVFTWNDDLVDGNRFFKFHYPVLRSRIETVPSFKEKKFCTLIATRLSSSHPNSLYKEREKIIEFFEDKEFDLYGKCWEKRKFKNYRGAIANKIEVLKNYKFCICYENTRDMKGYITEKIFDCFAAGSVPIYWGASNVEEYIPLECFIDRRLFASDEELYQFLCEISQEKYEGYLSAAEQFLKSEKAQLFSEKHFVKTVLSGLLTFIYTRSS